MDNMSELGIALAIRLCVGCLVARFSGRTKPGTSAFSETSKNWWDERQKLTGT